jgi:aldehyde:ferredoxin oxidoreductase
LGAICGVSDFAAIIKANEICDELGIDTMSVGVIIGFAMELFEILPRKILVDLSLSLAME